MDNSKRKYTWERNANAEIWRYDRFDTVEECVEDALDNEIRPGEKIAIGICKDYVPHIDADGVLDRLAENAYEECGEVAEGWPYFVPRQGYYGIEELEKALNEVLQEWLKKTEQVPKFCLIHPLSDLVEVRTKGGGSLDES